MDATVIVGLPGSGKTLLGKTLDGIFLDDIFKLDVNVLKEIKGSVIVADPFLIHEHKRKNLEKLLKSLGFSIKWIFFENNPDKAYKNVIRRNDGRVVSKRFIFEESKRYSIPDGVEIKEICS